MRHCSSLWQDHPGIHSKDLKDPLNGGKNGRVI